MSVSFTNHYWVTVIRTCLMGIDWLWFIRHPSAYVTVHFSCKFDFTNLHMLEYTLGIFGLQRVLTYLEAFSCFHRHFWFLNCSNWVTHFQSKFNKLLSSTFLSQVWLHFFMTKLKFMLVLLNVHIGACNYAVHSYFHSTRCIIHLPNGQVFISCTVTTTDYCCFVSSGFYLSTSVCMQHV